MMIAMRKREMVPKFFGKIELGKNLDNTNHNLLVPCSNHGARKLKEGVHIPLNRFLLGFPNVIKIVINTCLIFEMPSFMNGAVRMSLESVLNEILPLIGVNACLDAKKKHGVSQIRTLPMQQANFNASIKLGSVVSVQ
jgi:hypothetical protein